MQPTILSSAVLEQQSHLLDSIPLARAMQVRMLAHEPDRLLLGAPLAPNSNDKGCAFGGSLASLMTLAGWSLIEVMLREHEMRCDVFVADSQVRYLAPVWDDLRAEARLAVDTDREAFLNTLANRGKARVHVACEVRGSESGSPAATLEARFVAKRRAD